MCELKIVKHALHHNIRLVRRLAGETRIIGVVKGNGYGLGLVELAGHLMEYGVNCLAVSELEEALELRRWGLSGDIMLLSPLYDRKGLEEALHQKLILCVDSREGALAAERVARALDCRGRAQLCVDTGFGRYGFPWQQAQEIWEAARSLERLSIWGTYSHLSRSSEQGGQETRQQHRRLTHLCRELSQAGVEPGMLHLGESWALLKSPEVKLDGVRVGSAFLGRLPFTDQWGFEPIGSLRARVREVRTLAPGSTVGYGGSFVARQTTRIAVVGAGYAQGLGLERRAPVRGGRLREILGGLKRRPQEVLEAVAAGQRRFPVLGRVGMCDTVLDVTGQEIRVGEQVELPVNPIFVDSRVPRVYV